MKLHEMGEFSLIEEIKMRFHDVPDPIVGIGDDCAVIPQSQDQSLLVTTDLLVEDTHFLRSAIPPQDLGHKALAVNLSDIAAMGGRPLYCFLSFAAPGELDFKWLDGFLEGFRRLAEKHGVYLLGGDTSGSKNKLMISVTLLGECHPAKIKYRNTARPGDIVCVTDFLGDSAAGLRHVLNDIPRSDASAYLIKKHHHPRPQVEEGQWLAAQSGVHAMMDLSDGIFLDLQRLCDRSHCGAEIDLESLPISRELKIFCHQLGEDPKEIAALGGEDYALLFTVGAKDFEVLSRDFEDRFHRPLFSIGRVSSRGPSKDNEIRFFENGRAVRFHRTAFEHFKEKREEE